MKEKQEKLKEEEQKNPATEVSVGYDNITVIHCDIALLSYMARSCLRSFIDLFIYKGIYSLKYIALCGFFFLVF